MIAPSKESLPLKAPPQKFVISDDIVSKFYKAFNVTTPTGDWMPPTLAALALQGVFSIINEMKVDWRGLLHATQNFEYHSPIQKDDPLIAWAELTDCRLRAGMYWLQFKTEVLNEKTQEKRVTSKSLIMVKAS